MLTSSHGKSMRGGRGGRAAAIAAPDPETTRVSTVSVVREKCPVRRAMIAIQTIWTRRPMAEASKIVWVQSASSERRHNAKGAPVANSTTRTSVAQNTFAISGVDRVRASRSPVHPRPSGSPVEVTVAFRGRRHRSPVGTAATTITTDCVRYASGRCVNVGARRRVSTAGTSTFARRPGTPSAQSSPTTMQRRTVVLRRSTPVRVDEVRPAARHRELRRPPRRTNRGSPAAPSRRAGPSAALSRKTTAACGPMSLHTPSIAER